LQRAQAHIDAATRRTDVKVQAAMRRAEAKARAAEVRARNWQGKIVVGGRTVMNASGSTPAGDPVSDDERLVILKMLQEKKITLDEAEKLLAALEGK
jgi:predicted house-cleaning NTP pyrophosphatase (Maf/HAM1 superfamily)